LKLGIVNCLAGHYHAENFDQEGLHLIEDDFLREPVVAVHCKAGKGRTGLIICCFLLYTEVF
jgi:phosphatidylinositol-3,4,5-trisphosphate 3-phosphatase/dual-specificity protein phosphatase PTEN